MRKTFLDEEIRIQENHLGSLSVWEKWGPYLSERAWGTVREDYGPASGNPWSYVSHDMARKVSFHWGEDGIAGLSDRYQLIAFSLGLWNHRDPILKERLFGLTPDEGNHGEDVKELYYYLDNLPSHAYMRYLYKYPQQEFPYRRLVDENRKRSKREREFELLDTGIFDQNEYFDVFVEYAKESREDICMRIEVINRSDKEAILDVLPQVCFRNVWSWGKNKDKNPLITPSSSGDNFRSLHLYDDGIEAFPMLDIDYKIGERYLYAEGNPDLLFTNNESNLAALGRGNNVSPHVKDAFHRYIIDKEEKSIHPEKKGTKACFHYKDQVFPPFSSRIYRLRLTRILLKEPVANVDQLVDMRKKEADDYYALITPSLADAEEQKIFRQAISGQLWNKQLYLFIVNQWFKKHPITENVQRNLHWKHLVSKHVLVMPDKWEYPWFAAWDLSFHALTLALTDIALAKDHLWILLTEQFQHPNGQIPAYEWEFSDLNPPIQAWVAYRLFEIERERSGKGDLEFLKRCYHKLVTNFIWWVNREDQCGNNVFEGGFLGLDNITVLDRSMPIPGGGRLEQSDGTGWMGMFCLNMMRMTMEIAREDSSYECMITKFFQHFIYISSALMQSPLRQVQNWNEEDGFFYDVISHTSGLHEQIKVRSLVGIIPLFATDVFSKKELQAFPEFYPKFIWFMDNQPDLVKYCINAYTIEDETYYLFSLMGLTNMQRVLTKVWDTEEFRSPYGLRSLSKIHEKNPVSLFDNKIGYTPAESRIEMYGGNSNWRGPIWFPTSYLFIETLNKLHPLFDQQLSVASDATLRTMRDYFAQALIDIFKNIEGRRAVFGDNKKMQEDPHFFHHLLFYEYFHGDTGEGLGASHQTGWTALVANLIDMLRRE